jgi:poly [ADP-ribose] polymerase
MALSSTRYENDLGFENYNIVKKQTLNMLDAIKNSNKYYTIEIHESNGGYRIFTEYGRTGSSSVKEVRFPDNIIEAESEFKKIIKSKIRKGYREVVLIQSTTGSQKAKEVVEIRENDKKLDIKLIKTKNNLNPSISSFVKQIYSEADQKLSYLTTGNINSKDSNVLGTLSVVQIDKGRNILQEIANVININSNINITDIIQLSNEYYSNIPRAFGRKITPEQIAINTLDKINEEMDVLKFYEDSIRLGDITYEVDNINKQYEALKSEIDILIDNNKYNEIVHYVNSTESNHHGVKLVVKNIFTIKQKNAPKFISSCGNIKELFHGTRTANMPGILSTHLRLPNQLKGVHITGAMFGSGLYFADQSTKSSQYSCSRFGGTTNKYKTSFMFLVEVALGKIKEEEYSKYYSEAPRGYNSVKGVAGRSLLHNEYIIYKEDQQQLKYIIEFETKRK